jgi:hypothetical protein
MRKVGLIGVAIVSATVLTASPISLNWSSTQNSFALSQTKLTRPWESR